MDSTPFSTEQITSLAQEYEHKHPSEIISLALDNIDQLAISFSGAEDVVLIDMAIKLNPSIKVFSLDTYRLHAETYDFIKKVEAHYSLIIDLITPQKDTLAAFVAEKGEFSFYETGHKECCGIRKTEPLRRALAQQNGWITGQRKDQSPDTRNHIAVIENDELFASDTALIKFNPLANWSSAQVWQYIRDNNVPYNALHDRGYRSIGCEPCTRAVKPEEHERAGRWWWEEATAKECGLHQANIVAKS